MCCSLTHCGGPGSNAAQPTDIHCHPLPTPPEVSHHHLTTPNLAASTSPIPPSIDRISFPTAATIQLSKPSRRSLLPALTPVHVVDFIILSRPPLSPPRPLLQPPAFDPRKSSSRRPQPAPSTTGNDPAPTSRHPVHALKTPLEILTSSITSSPSRVPAPIDIDTDTAVPFSRGGSPTQLMPTATTPPRPRLPTWR